MKKLQSHCIRVKLDARSEKINFKIREAQIAKIPYMLVIGDKEMESGCVSVRHRKDGDLGTFVFENFLQKINLEIENKI